MITEDEIAAAEANLKAEEAWIAAEKARVADMKAEKERLEREAAYKAAREAEEAAFQEAWASYKSTLTEEQARRVWSAAWEAGHSCGLQEVALYFDDFADLCVDVMKMMKRAGE